tara:strand:+ start:344 stop:859 length:516 start_codon:yes stop_codon:yes gene_type:complete
MEIKEFRKRTRRLLPKSKDLDLWILKGHLLIEEQVNRLIEQGMCDTRYLKEARLSSQQKIKIAQAMTGKGYFEREWDFIESLNSIRNKLAHKVEVDNLESIVDCVIKPFMSSRFKKSRTKSDRVERFEFCISMTIGILSGMEETHNSIFSKPGSLLAWNTALYHDEIKKKC